MIQNPMKLESNPILATFKNQTTYLDFTSNYEELFGWKFEFCRTRSENAVFFEKFKIS